MIKNSAVNAKIHAKLKNSLKAKDYDKMVSFSTVSQLAAFLKQNAEYKEALADVSAESIHRGELERRLKTVINKNIRSLITFSSESDKAFLTLFDIRDEIWNLKILLRLLFRPSEGYSPNYIETGTLDYEKLFRARTFEDFTELLKDTVYYKVFKPFLGHPEKQSLFELETALDSLYQNLTFEYIKKYLSKEEQKIAEKSLFNYYSKNLGMEIATIKRKITMVEATPLDEKYLELGDFNCLPMITSRIYNNEGTKFEFSESRNRPDLFVFNSITSRSLAPKK